MIRGAISQGSFLNVIKRAKGYQTKGSQPSVKEDWQTDYRRAA
jgi:hypothetical protein